MYLLKLYNWDYYGELDDILLYHSKTYAEDRAKDIMQTFIEEHRKRYGDEPDDYGYRTWKEFIQDVINNGQFDEVFKIEQITPED